MQEQSLLYRLGRGIWWILVFPISVAITAYLTVSGRRRDHPQEQDLAQRVGRCIAWIVVLAVSIATVTAFLSLILGAIIGLATGMDVLRAMGGFGLPWWVGWAPWPLVAVFAGYQAHRAIGGGWLMGALVGALNAGCTIHVSIEAEVPKRFLFYVLAALVVCGAAAGGWFASRSRPKVTAAPCVAAPR